MLCASSWLGRCWSFTASSLLPCATVECDAEPRRSSRVASCWRSAHHRVACGARRGDRSGLLGYQRLETVTSATGRVDRPSPYPAEGALYEFRRLTTLSKVARSFVPSSGTWQGQPRPKAPPQPNFRRESTTRREEESQWGVPGHERPPAPPGQHPRFQGEDPEGYDACGRYQHAHAKEECIRREAQNPSTVVGEVQADMGPEDECSTDEGGGGSQRPLTTVALPLQEVQGDYDRHRA